MESNIKRVKAKGTIQEACLQYLEAQAEYRERPSEETNAAMLRSLMVVRTKEIELTPEQRAELRELAKKAGG